MVEPEVQPNDDATAPSLVPAAEALPVRRRELPRLLKIAFSFLCGGSAAALIVYTFDARARREHEMAAQRRAAEMTAAFVTAAVEGGVALELDAAVVAVDAAPPVVVPPPVWRVAEMKGDPSIELAEGFIGKRPFSTAIIVTGASRAEMQRILKAFQGVRTFDRVGPKDTFVIAKEKKTGHILAFEYATSPAEVWQARETSPGVLEGKRLDLVVERIRVAVGVVVGDDLRASLEKAGLDDDLLQRLDDALEGHAELADLRPGARLRIVATDERVQGKFTRYVELDAVEYTPATGATVVRVYHHASGKAQGYYDSRGHQPYRGGWRTPVPLARISSRFNLRRVHPVLHVVMPHTGVDFAAAPGTPVYSAAAGTVQSVGDGGPCGNMVQVKHPNGLVSAYCHLSRFAQGLHQGLRVDARQLVGFVGQTGRATGPHLHFAVKRGETFIDPLALKLDGVRVLPPEARDEFATARLELDGVLDGIGTAVAGDAGVPTMADAGPEETILDEAP